MRLFGIEVPASLDEAVVACRDHFRLTAALSALVNLLYLAPTLYMMQVYDRAVPTGGVTTLVWLTVVVAFALGTLAILDALRMRVLLRASLRLDNRLSVAILEHAIGPQRHPATRAQHAMREFDNLRAAVAGPPAIALFDIVWTPIYILVAFMVHPAIGALAIVTALVLLGITVTNERANRVTSLAALQMMSVAYALQERMSQRSELIRSLGMQQAMITRLQQDRERGLHLSAQQQFKNGRYAAFAKFIRLFSQSVALGLGAWLAIQNQITVGSIIAASVLVSRALSPIEMLVGSWAGVAQARQAIASLGLLLGDTTNPAETSEHFELPAPRGVLAIVDITVESPTSDARALLADISFNVNAGEFIGIIGPSGAGKSTLARVLSGALIPDRGKVRIDGSNMRDWDPERLAQHIGYLPQDAALLPGTIAENISRFSGLRGQAADITARAVLEASDCAGVHDLIVSLPGGYDRRIGWSGEELSAGQRQRIALARAVYGNPALLVLDEPNSALDAEGEGALLRTIASVRARSGTVLMVTHRAPLLANATRLLLLANGRLNMFGKYEDVLAALNRPVATPALADMEA